MKLFQETINGRVPFETKQPTGDPKPRPKPVMYVHAWTGEEDTKGNWLCAYSWEELLEREDCITAEEAFENDVKNGLLVMIDPEE